MAFDWTSLNPITYAMGKTTGKNSLKKQIDSQIAARPKYNINEEAYQNQDLARNQAFGRDRAIQGMETQIEQGAADTAGMLQNYSGSASSILSALGSINESKNASLRGLAVNEAGLRRGKMQDLYGANMNLVDEKDKEWNYNVNDPYQLKLEELRMRRKARQENAWKIADTATSLASASLM